VNEVLRVSRSLWSALLVGLGLNLLLFAVLGLLGAPPALRTSLPLGQVANGALCTAFLTTVAVWVLRRRLVPALASPPLATADAGGRLQSTLLRWVTGWALSGVIGVCGMALGLLVGSWFQGAVLTASSVALLLLQRPRADALAA
jgi:hypothetical protein